jgi:hypothetical protein
VKVQFRNHYKKKAYNCSTILDTDSDRYVSELDVVEDDGALKVTIARTAALNEGRGVGNDRVDDCLCADTLRTGVGGATLRQGKANFAVVYRNPLEGPAPVPNSVDL